MPSTYTNDPGGNNVDLVRFLANDRTEPMYLTDEEIEFLVDEAGNADSAASDAAEMIAGILSTRADKTVGPLSIKYSDQSQQYLSLAARLRSRYGRFAGGPVLTQHNNEHYFTLGMHDHYASGIWYPNSILGEETLVDD